MRILKMTTEPLPGDIYKATCIVSDGQTATCLAFSTGGAPSRERIQELLDTSPDLFTFHGPD